MSKVTTLPEDMRTKAVGAIHSEICEESLEDHLAPDWPGRCVRAVEAVMPFMEGTTDA